jgi:hypothetical protein
MVACAGHPGEFRLDRGWVTEEQLAFCHHCVHLLEEEMAMALEAEKPGSVKGWVGKSSRQGMTLAQVQAEAGK